MMQRDMAVIPLRVRDIEPPAMAAPHRAATLPLAA